MNRNIILFSSSYLYLTFPQFESLIPELDGFKKILLNVNELLSYRLDNKYINEKKTSQLFDIIIKIK